MHETFKHSQIFWNHSMYIENSFYTYTHIWNIHIMNKSIYFLESTTTKKNSFRLQVNIVKTELQQKNWILNSLNWRRCSLRSLSDLRIQFFCCSSVFIQYLISSCKKSKQMFCLHKLILPESRTVSFLKQTFLSSGLFITAFEIKYNNKINQQNLNN